MSLDRRNFLKGAIAASALAATPATGFTAQKEQREPLADDVGMLYDSTRCVGCMACMSACKRRNDLPVEHTDESQLYDDPVMLSSKTKTVIKSTGGPNPRFIKRQCMHCVKPACVSVCMLGALHKSTGGVVVYDANRCVGCRYCQIACAFNVPKFEWDKALPKIVKCEMCHDRLVAGEQPGCCEVCPREAVIFGRRHELLAEARRRIKSNPNYLTHIYGEHEVGGLQVLYISDVPFTKLGLPDLGNEPVPELSETVQHGIYRGFVAPVALYAALATVLVRHRKSHQDDEGGDDIFHTHNGEDL
ncbi:MAG: hydrogenase 2 operon protein HybA [Planctomycetes bacterium]|nr:hydrogenase 2 operon protein HybA [Planctomycetota bacterium]